MIYRPVKMVQTKTARTLSNSADISIQTIEVPGEVEIGGLDACPECTAAAEIDAQQ